MNESKTRKYRLPAIVRWILWVLLVQFILINISTSIYAYRFTHFYTAKKTDENKSSNIFTKTWKLFTGPRQLKSLIKDEPVFSYETVYLDTGVKKIEAWYGKVDSLPKGTVILFHGISSNKASLLQEAYEFRYWGYNVLLVDFRGHGNSSGNKSTIGYYESKEVKQAFDFIRATGEQRIFLYGVSLGAVVIAKAVDEYNLKPSGLVLDMPFLSLQSYVKNRARVLGFPEQPFAFLTTFWIGVEQGFNGFRHQTTRYVKNLDCPVLMQWGVRDEFILKKETEQVFEAIGSSQKKLVRYENAKHESFVHQDPARWRMELEEFLKNN